MTAWNPGGNPDPNQPPQYGSPPPPPQGYGPPPQQGYGGQPAYGGYPGAPGGSTVGNPANMGQRFAAYLIDAVIIAVPFGILFGIAVAAFVKSATTSCGFDSNNDYNCTGSSGSGGGILILLYFLLVVGAILYPVILNGGKRQATIGKSVMGLKVVDANNGTPIGYGRAFIREILKGICFIIALSPFFDSSGKVQGWQDKAANDLVISTK